MLCCSEQFGCSRQRSSGIASVGTDDRKWQLPTLSGQLCMSLCAPSPPAISLESEIALTAHLAAPGEEWWEVSLCAAFPEPVQREGLLTLFSFMSFWGQGFMCIWERERLIQLCFEADTCLCYLGNTQAQIYM